MHHTFHTQTHTHILAQNSHMCDSSLKGDCLCWYLGCFPKSSVSKPLLSPPLARDTMVQAAGTSTKATSPTSLPPTNAHTRATSSFPLTLHTPHAPPHHHPDPLGAFAVLNPAPSHSLQSPARPPLSTPPPTSLLGTLFSHRSFFWTTPSSLQGPGLTLLLRFQLGKSFPQGQVFDHAN